MILDNLKNINCYKGISKNMDIAIDYLMNCNFEDSDVGKYDVDGENIYCIIQEYATKAIEDGKFEAHRNYIDIQLVLKGEEYIGYAPVKDLIPIGDYDSNKDKINLSGAGEMHLIKSNMFGIYFPHDGHKPSIHHTETNIKKAVVKIKV